MTGDKIRKAAEVRLFREIDERRAEDPQIQAAASWLIDCPTVYLANLVRRIERLETMLIVKDFFEFEFRKIRYEIDGPKMLADLDRRLHEMEQAFTAKGYLEALINELKQEVTAKLEYDLVV
ncbi:hypothetical protein HY633_00360 [Candidatus Uhrbacteria bacterium]|nr:hypothetical protein [Candidatus Uhrbacteria bacterium]